MVVRVLFGFCDSIGKVPHEFFVDFIFAEPCDSYLQNIIIIIIGQLIIEMFKDCKTKNKNKLVT